MCTIRSSAKCEATTRPTISASPRRIPGPRAARQPSASTTDHTTVATTLCEYGMSYRSSGFDSVNPGTMRRCSIPARMKTPQSTSTAWAATKSTHSGIVGRTRWRASAGA